MRLWTEKWGAGEPYQTEMSVGVLAFGPSIPPDFPRCHSSSLHRDSGSQKLQRFGENRGFSHLCRGSTIEVQTKNSTDLEPVPGTELKSVEFFVCTSICQQSSPILSVKRLKRLMHLLGSGVYRTLSGQSAEALLEVAWTAPQSTVD